MRFTNLQIENFLVLTEAKLNLADRGLILIQGVNAQDSSAASNGAGKSSIADALCWALYGVTARGESGDAVVNHKAGKNTLVSVDIEDNGVVYTITRHRKHKTGKNNLTVKMDEGFGKVTDLTKGTDKLTQDVVQKIIGASLDVFAGSIYAGQEKMPDLPAMTDKVLKLLIEEAAGITALEEAYKLARDNASSAKTDYELVQRDVAMLEATVSMQKSAVESLNHARADWITKRDDDVKVRSDVVRSSHMPSLADMKSKIDGFGIEKIRDDIEKIDARIASVETEKVRLRELQAEVSKANSQVTIREGNVRHYEAQQKAAEDHLATIKSAVGAPCTACGRPITEHETGTAEQHALDEIDKIRAVVVAEKGELANAQSAAEKAAEGLKAFEATLTDVSAELASRGALSESVRAYEDLERNYAGQHTFIKSEIEAIKTLKEAISPYEKQIADATAALDSNQEDLKKKNLELDVRAKKLALENEVVKVFAPAGVRARVLDEVTPYLNDQTAKYLSIMSDGNISAEWSTISLTKTGKATERFAIDVTSVSSAQSFKGLSGGEKRKVRLSTALALQDLVATRATKPIDLFIGDEVDDALDASGLERLMVILDEKAKERGTVMVISHNNLKDEIRNVLTVSRSAAGETTITETAA